MNEVSQRHQNDRHEQQPTCHLPRAGNRNLFPSHQGENRCLKVMDAERIDNGLVLRDN